MKDFSFRGVVCAQKESDAACWGVTEAKGPLKKLYFKLPSLKPNEARIKVLHAGLCHSDCYMADQEWGPLQTLPLVPGHEIIAQVDKVGGAVKNFKAGDVVAFGVFRDCCGECEYCRNGNDQLCVNCPYKGTYDPYLGGYSTYMHVRADFLYSVPKNLPQNKIAPLLCAGATVFSPLKRWGKAGIRCGIIGIGGLGHLAIQCASKMGMHTVAISTSTSKEKEAREFGAKEFICSKNEADMKRFKSTDRVDLIINTALMHDLTEYLYGLNPTGCFVQTGAPEVSKSLIFNHMDLIGGQKIITGSAVGSRKEVADTLKFCGEYNICPVVESYKWDEFPKAYKRLHDCQPKYRCVVDVASTYKDS